MQLEALDEQADRGRPLQLHEADAIAPPDDPMTWDLYCLGLIIAALFLDGRLGYGEERGALFWFSEPPAHFPCHHFLLKSSGRRLRTPSLARRR